MAVYTKFSEKDIKLILSNYNIGNLDSFKGIEEGIENTNYLLLVNEKKYILTVYEKRVKEKDLPFFSELMTNLNKSGYLQKPFILITIINSTEIDLKFSRHNL